jgi:hypothetical protein
MTSEELLDLVVAAIVNGGTGAEDRAYRPGDWPTQGDQYPILKLRVITETKQSLGKGEVQFSVTTTVQCVGEVSAAALPRDQGAQVAERKLWRLMRQVEVAVINSYPLFQYVEQLASVQTQLAYNSEGETHLAGIDMRLAFEHFQGEEDFAPIDADELLEATVDDVAHAPTGLHLTFTT